MKLFLKKGRKKKKEKGKNNEYEVTVLEFSLL